MTEATDKTAGFKHLLSMSRVIRFNVFHTGSDKPNDSKDMGMKRTPKLAHCWESCSNFLSSATVRASSRSPDVLTALETILCCSWEVMFTSRAAGCPAEQQGKYTAPGQEFVCCVRFFCPQTGDRLAALQADIKLSLSRACREIILPRPWHVTAGSVYLMILFHNRDNSFFFHTLEPPVVSSQLRKTSLAGEGDQLPVWELPITRLLMEAERVTKCELSPYLMFDFQ